MLGSRFDFSETLNDIASHRSVSVDVEETAFDTQPVTRADSPDVLDTHCVTLEQEMMAVARTLHSKHPKVSFRCPVCDNRMEIRDEKALTEFGTLDVKLHELECTDCGMLTGRVFHPSVGYHTLVR